MTSMYDWTKTAMPGTSYGQPMPTDPMTGQQDFMSVLNPMTSLKMGSNSPLNTSPSFDMSFGTTPTSNQSFLDSAKSWLSDSGFLGSKLPDGTQVQGWGMPALSAVSGLTNAFFGMQQLGVARDTLEQNKKQFQMNFDAQRKTTNAQLEDRQRARVASNSGAYQSVSDYMGKYGI